MKNILNGKSAIKALGAGVGGGVGFLVAVTFGPLALTLGGGYLGWKATEAIIEMAEEKQS